MKKVTRVNENEVGIRLDKYLSNQYKEYSRVYLQKAIEENKVLVNGKSEKASYKVNLDDEITFEDLGVQELNVKAQDINLDIVYEDKDIIVINKPQGMIVHPAPGVNEDTLVNALLHHCKDLSTINGVKRPGIVHRIDKDTSGLLVVAKNDFAHNSLAKQLKDKTMHREYYAIVHGVINEAKGKIDAPIGRDPKSRVKMAVVKDGKPAVTHFEVKERYKGYTLIYCKLETGRTHQIRVHLSYIGHPLAGDPLYGVKPTLPGDGQFLHAYKLTLVHPRTEKIMEFIAPLPEYFKDIILSLKK